MVKEAESHASEDAQRREEIELRNQTDSLIYSIERTLREQGRSISDTDRRPIEQAIADARDALNGQDVQRIRRAHDNLEQAGRTLGDAISRAGAVGAGAGAQGSQQPTEGDVIDAEVVDDRKG